MVLQSVTTGGLAGSDAYYGLLASAPPLPAPGRKILDTLGFMQVYGHPFDLLFFHSWPEEIGETVQTDWHPIIFPGAAAPIEYIYTGNEWLDYKVDLTFHNSNPIQPIKFNGGSVAVQFANIFLDVMRIQLQVAWCKSVCLPNTERLNNAAKNLITQSGPSVGQQIASAATGQEFNFSAALKNLMSGFGDVLTEVGRAFTSLSENGLREGSFFPPLIATQYGSFLRMYGYCTLCNIQYKPPFVPLFGYPQMADVSMTFKRMFPFNLPTRSGARTKLGWMI